MTIKQDLNNKKGTKQYAKELSLNSAESEVEEDFDLELDIGEAIVQSIDGVLIKEDGEVKMLFYHYKADGIDNDEQTIRCKGIAEFRTTKSTFLSIAKELNEKACNIKKQRRGVGGERHSNVSMYV